MKTESRRVETRTIHLRQASRVGEKCREENWGGCRPSVPSRDRVSESFVLVIVNLPGVQCPPRRGYLDGSALCSHPAHRVTATS